jgi:hypothetical protein
MLRSLMLTSLSLLLGCATRKANTQEASAPSDTSAQVLLVFGRGPCFGDCPSYKVTLFQNGRVRFGEDLGREFEPPSEAVVAPAAIEKIRSLAERLDPLDAKCCDCYDMTDMSSATITYRRRDGKLRTIDHYHGCERAPDWLYSVENEIDAALETDRWLGRKVEYKPYHPSHLGR